MEVAAFTARTPRRGGAHNARVTPFPWRSRKNAKRFCETIAWGQKKKTVSLRSDLPNSILFTGKVFLGPANDPRVFMVKGILSGLLRSGREPHAHTVRRGKAVFAVERLHALAVGVQHDAGIAAVARERRLQ